MKNNITLSRDLNLLDITLIGVGAMKCILRDS